MTTKAPIVESVPFVCEFFNIFPVDLSGLPLERDIDFAIEVDLATKPISIPPYRLAPTKLKDLNTQLWVCCIWDSYS